MWKWIRNVFVGLFVLGAVARLIGVDEGSNSTSTADAASGFSGSSGQSNVIKASTAPTLPPDQEAFIKVVDGIRTKYKSAANDMAAGGLRVARRNTLCQQFSDSFNVTDWVGRISELSSNNDGKGVLGIEIAKGISVTTWNNAVSDISYETLIDPSSPVFGEVSQLREGSKVKFSGTFFKDEQDCFKEGSMSQAGSMGEPEFIFSFTNVERL